MPTGNIHDKLFSSESRWARSTYTQYAQDLSLDMTRLRSLHDGA